VGVEFVQTVSAVVVGMCAGLIAFALARMPRPSLAGPAYAFVAAGVLWAVGDVVASRATDMLGKQVGLALLYTGSITLPALWWTLALRWAEDVGADLPFRSPAWTVAPLVFAGAMWAVMITNPWHGAFITPVLGGRNVYEPFWYVMTVPAYGLILAALGVEIWAAGRVARSEVRRQAGFMIAASAVTLLGNFVYVTDTAPFNVTALVLAVSAALLVIGMAREGLFGVLPAVLPSVADDHPDGLLIVGPDEQVRYANARAAELLAPLEVRPGVDVRETLRAPALRVEQPARLDADDAEQWWAALTRPEGILVYKDGSAGDDEAARLRWLHVGARAVRGRRGRLRGWCVRVSDWTAQQQLERQQRQARRLDSVASLARTVSAELRGSFSVIRGNAEMLAGESDEPAQERKLWRIVEAAHRGLDLASQLQLYAGSVDASRIVLELSAIADEIVGLVEEDRPATVGIRVERAQGPLPVDADPLQLRHAIFELLMNALESMPEAGGVVSVRTGSVRLDPTRMEHLVHGRDEPPGDFACIRIADQGGGMTADVEERAFEPYFSTRHKDRGNGLPTVLGIVRAHDALLELDNRPGHGCTLTLYLPLNAESGLEAPRVEEGA